MNKISILFGFMLKTILSYLIQNKNVKKQKIEVVMD